MSPAYMQPAVTIYAEASVSAILNVQVNCEGSLYGTDACKMAIADFQDAGGAYLLENGQEFNRNFRSVRAQLLASRH